MCLTVCEQKGCKSRADYVSLSLAAKAYFILTKEKKPMSETEILKKSKEFDWKVSENNIKQSLEILTKLALPAIG